MKAYWNGSKNSLMARSGVPRFRGAAFGGEDAVFRREDEGGEKDEGLEGDDAAAGRSR